MHDNDMDWFHVIKTYYIILDIKPEMELFYE